jgi:hypothetical protein
LLRTVVRRNRGRLAKLLTGFFGKVGGTALSDACVVRPTFEKASAFSLILFRIVISSVALRAGERTGR